MAIRTKSDIVTSLTQYLQARFPRIDVTSARPLASLLFDVFAEEIESAYEALDQVQVEQGVSDPATSSTEGMDDLAYNWNLTRRGAVAATGIVTFQKTTAPTATIQIGSQDGTGGVIVGTSRQSTGSVVLFVTTETVFLTTSTTVNPQNGLYEVDAEVECLQLGEVGNVNAGLITVLQSPVPGVGTVTNKISTTGGKEEEDNATLASRIVAKVQGLQPGTVDGLISAAMAEQNVTDATAVGPNDDEFTRTGTGGAVDLVILGQQITSSVQFSTFVTGQNSVTLSNKPATAITSVVAAVGLTQTTLTKDVDYSFSQDTVSANAYSASSNDHLSWLSGSLPNNNTQVTINYQYDKAVNDIQSILDATDKHFVTADVLVKRATQVLVDIALTVKKSSGYDSTVVQNNVSAAISNHINNLGLGEEVQQSDLVVEIKQAAGVASITLPFTTLARRGSSGVADIEPTKYEYCRVDSTSLTITVTT